jgi:hypothetical protein
MAEKKFPVMGGSLNDRSIEADVDVEHWRENPHEHRVGGELYRYCGDKHGGHFVFVGPA